MNDAAPTMAAATGKPAAPAIDPAAERGALRAELERDAERRVLEAVARERQLAVDGLERQREEFELAFAEQVRDFEAFRFEAKVERSSSASFSSEDLAAAAERRMMTAIEVERLLARAETQAAVRCEGERWERRLAHALGEVGLERKTSSVDDDVFALQQEHVRAAEAIDLAMEAVRTVRAEAAPLRAERDAAVAESARLAAELENSRGALVRLSFDAAASATHAVDESDRATAGEFYFTVTLYANLAHNLTRSP